MKLFIIAAVLIASVCAEPESDAEAKPWLAYSNYGYAGYPYASYAAGYAGYPYAAGVYGSGVYGSGYNGYALGGAHYIGKRSADSDAEAKPWLTYANTYAGVAGYPYASYAHAAYPYAGLYGAGLYNGYNGYALGATHYIGKRSAEAEAEPEAWYGAYNGYAGVGAYGYGSRYATYAPYTYGARYGGYRYASPYTYGGYGYGK